MFGWLADSFRFAWGLLYWNTRKSWFRLRRGRAECPCQSPSDSGRALETRCDACVSWNRPERFKAVCPLLVPTKDGLRCSVNTVDVRPFWGRVGAWYGGAVLGLYAAGAIAVFAFLRTIGYPVSIVQVALPPLWHQVGQARGWYFFHRSELAFAAGKTSEGLLYLTNAYEFDPANYAAGLALARAYQLTQPARSDQIFEKLLREHPEHRAIIAQQWFLALLARGEFKEVASLARVQLAADPARANVWMRALLFATAHSGDNAPLRSLLAAPDAAARIWRPVVETELAIRDRHPAEARARLDGTWPANAPGFAAVYRVETLVALGDPTAALDLLLQLRSQLDDEAYLTLRLHCLAAAGADRMVRTEFRQFLLNPPLTQPTLKVMCAQLIRHPDRMLFSELCAKVQREGMPLRDDTAGGWFSLLCTAGALGDTARLHEFTLQLRQASGMPFAALSLVDAFFRNPSVTAHATSFLPYLPVPLEVMYALIDRYPGGHPALHARSSAP